MSTPNTQALDTLMANMRHAVRDCKNSTIGGGVFTPAELEQAMSEIAHLRAALKHLQTVTHPMANDDDIGAAAEFLIRAEGETLPNNSGYWEPTEWAKAGGNVCPACGSDDLDTEGSLDADGNSAHQTVRCGSCNATWSDQWTLTGFNNLETAAGA